MNETHTTSHTRRATPMKSLNSIALFLIIVGGLNWGLIGLFEFNLVAAIFGGVQWLERLIYILVGIAAVYSLYLFKPVTAFEDQRRHEHAPVTR